MMFVLSGEGPTDIGKCDYDTGAFAPGPMSYFIDIVVRDKIGFSPLETHCAGGNAIHFVPKKDLANTEV
ncbi:MAG: hypothetical protein PHO09_12130, partial [Sphaerochaeta sp.]|nr:hypothetical protein [Sphaerochaeta sp.]